MKGHARKLYVRAILAVCLSVLVLGNTEAAQFSVFEKNYLRGTEAPQQERDTFSVLNPNTIWKLQAINGGMQDGETEYEKVSSATLSVNNVDVLRPNQFNQSTVNIEENVALSPSNIISAVLRSRPGGCLYVKIVGQDDTPPVTLWQAPTAGQLFKTQLISPVLVLQDDISGLAPATLRITDNSLDITDKFVALAAPTLNATLSAELSFAEGEHTLLAQIADQAGQAAQPASLKFTVDVTSPVINALSPQHGTTVTESTPLISAEFSDNISGINAASVRLMLDANDVTSLAEVTSSSITYIPQNLIPDGNHTISVSVADKAGNIASQSATFLIATLEPPVVNAYSGYIHGKTIDSNSDASLSRVIVSVIGVNGSMYTDNEGKFAFPVPGNGEYILKFEKEGCITSERTIRVTSARDISVGDVYMKQLDPAITAITNAGGVHQNSSGTLEFTFPPNALPAGVDSVNVQATLYEKGRELPSPLPRSSMFTYAFKVLPDKVNFTQPVSGRLANQLGFAPGTSIPIGYYNPDKHKWEDTGLKGIVSPDGAWVNFQINHFCAYDINLPPTWRRIPGVADLTKNNNMVSLNCAKDCGNSTILLKSGELIQSHVLPKYHFLDEDFQLDLTYNSRCSLPGALLSLEAFNPASTTVPRTISSNFFLEGRQERTYYKGVGGKLRMSYFFDAVNGRGEVLPTGSYPYLLEAANNYTDVTYGTADYFGGPVTGNTGVMIRETVPYINAIKGRICINNQQNSPFGSGWSLSGLQHLYFDPDGSIGVTEGDGSMKSFKKQRRGSIHLATTNFANTVLVALNNGDGTFQNPVGYDNAGFQYNLVIGDFNGDGFTDLVVPIFYQNIVSVFCGNGDGTFQPRISSSVAYSPSSCIAGDFNQDGFMDLVVAHTRAPRFSVLLGNGDATFKAPIEHDSGYKTGCIAAADFNQDGILDLATTKFDLNGCVSIYFGNGDGTFNRYAENPLPPYPGKVITGDFNNDKMMDLAIAYPDLNSTVISVLLGNGDGSFQPYKLCFTNNGIASMITGDFNQDGILDLATTHANNHPYPLAILLGIGDGTFQAPQSYAVPARAMDVTCGDFNLDGIPDLAVGHYGGNYGKISLLFGKGDGTFNGPTVIYPDANMTFSCIRAFDLIATPENEAFPDNCYASFNGDYTYIMKNPDAAFTRYYKDGTRVIFNSQGLETQVIDRSGNTLNYEYTDAAGDGFADELETITLPNNQQYRLTYADAKLASIIDPAGRVTGFTVDGQGNLRQIKNPDNSIKTFNYDDHHLMTQKIDERGFITEYDYDSCGMITQVRSPAREISGVDENGNLTAGRTVETRNYIPADAVKLINSLPYGTGSENNPADIVMPEEVIGTFIDAKGNAWKYKTDKYGGRLQFTDPLNNVTQYQRDVHSNLCKLIRANGSAQTLNYDGLGNLVRVKEEYNGAVNKVKYNLKFSRPVDIEDALSNKTHIDYDDKGNAVAISDAKGVISNLEYNSRGQVVRVVNAAGTAEQAETRFEYAPNTFNLTKVIDPLNQETLYSYDTAGNVVSITDAEGKTVRFTYDEMNRLKTSVDADDKTTVYEYYPGGYIKSVTDAKQQITNYFYDEQGQLAKTVNSLGLEEKMGYDANRNLSQVITARGDAIKFYYDAANLLRTKFLPKSGLTELVNFNYNSLYNLTNISDDDSSLSFEYDPLSRLVSAATNAGFIQPRTAVSYAYDLNNNPTKLTYPDAGYFNYEYDQLNRLTTVKDQEGASAASYIYDTLSRRSNLSLADNTTIDYVYNKLSQLLSLTSKFNLFNTNKITYVYDRAGNRTSMSDSEGRHTYGYDNLYRLVTASHPDLSTENYSYDALGNRNPAQYSYDAANRLLEDNVYTYAYDNNGNMISRRNKTTGETTTCVYDSEDQLIQITGPGLNACYCYDALGRRIEKNVNGTITRYVYDGEDIIAAYDASDALIAKYIHGPGIDEPILLNSKFQIPDSKFYYHFDGLGSVAAVTNEAGAIVESYEYDAFGNTTIRNTQGVILTTSQIDNRYMFTGREYDNESGLYYYRARYYDPAIGRFLQEDPIWGTNLYSYVDNNPVNYVDPWGLQAIVPNLIKIPEGINIPSGIFIPGGKNIPGFGENTIEFCMKSGNSEALNFYNKKGKEGELPNKGEHPFVPKKHKGKGFLKDKFGRFIDKWNRRWKWDERGQHWDVSFPKGGHINVKPDGYIHH